MPGADKYVDDEAPASFKFDKTIFKKDMKMKTFNIEAAIVFPDTEQDEDVSPDADELAYYGVNRNEVLSVFIYKSKEDEDGPAGWYWSNFASFGLWVDNMQRPSAFYTVCFSGSKGEDDRSVYIAKMDISQVHTK